MRSDYEIARLIEPLCAIYSDIELEMVLYIAERLNAYDGIKGSLEWYVAKLDEMHALDGDFVNLIARYTGNSNSTILNMLEEAGFSNIDVSALTKAYDLGVIPYTPSQLMESEQIVNLLKNSYEDIVNGLKFVQTNAVQGAKQDYLNALNKAYIETASGFKDAQSAIDGACIELAKKGITTVTYKRGDSTVEYNLEGVVRRNVMTETFRTANNVAIRGALLEGINHLAVSSHLGARDGDGGHNLTNHGWWQGKVYRIEGKDEKYENFEEITGYDPITQTGDIQGFAGVNCRHRCYEFIDGISTNYAEQYDSLENKEYYDAQQKQRYYERQIRDNKRCLEVARFNGDEKEIANRKRLLQNSLDKYFKLIDRFNETHASYKLISSLERTKNYV